MDTLFIVMPAYNEEANIESTVAQWYPILAQASSESRLVIADSGSSDRTHEILTDLQASHPQLEILADSDRYHGPKVIALYKYAIAHGADLIFQTDSDGQTNPAEFADFWAKRNERDATIGYRPVRGDGQDRKFVENVVCMLLNHYFKVQVPDANAPFRLMRASLVDKYIGRFADDYNLPNIMFTTFFSYYHENIEFLPISFKPRGGGKNSVNIPSIVKIGCKALGDFREFKKNM